MPTLRAKRKLQHDQNSFICFLVKQFCDSIYYNLGRPKKIIRVVNKQSLKCLFFKPIGTQFLVNFLSILKAV